MKRILTALVLIPLVLLAVFRAPDWFFTSLVGIVAILATVEYLQIVEAYGIKPARFVTYGFSALLFAVLAMVLQGGVPVSFALAAGVIVFVLGPSIYLALGMRENELRDVLPSVSTGMFGLLYISIALACLAFVRALPEGWFFVLLTFFCVWGGDTAAYYVGRSIGRIKFAPRVSPKKTWEGAIASVLAAVAIAFLFCWWAPSMQEWLYAHGILKFSPQKSLLLLRAPSWAIALAGAVINIAAQQGDLFESLIKRGAGVKDSGTMLPGHGGILDRIDALLFAAPVSAILFVIAGDKFLKGF